MAKARTTPLTQEQKAVVEAAEDVLTVTAFAGTGKTTTLKAFAKARPRSRILYLAFNRALAEDSKAAFSELGNVEVRTIHSLAYSRCGRQFQNTLGNIKAIDIIPFLKPLKVKHLQKQYDIARIVLEAYNDWLLSDHKTPDSFFKSSRAKIAAKLGPGEIKPKQIFTLVKSVWQASLAGEFTMPHNGYLKLFELTVGDALDHFDYILVDEAQDLNDCMISIIISNSAKKVFVGDPYQQIYGFNGAVDALAKTAVKGAANFYLTKSFRCPAEIAEVANQYLKILGSPKTFSGVDEAPPKKVATGELIIARTNASLFDFIAKQIENKKFYYNTGFESYRFDTILEIVRLINKEVSQINDPFIKKFKNINELEEYVESTNDGVANTRIKIAKRYNKKAFFIYNQMQSAKMSNESQAHYIATTAHKIKGREYEKVHLLGDFVAIDDAIGKATKFKELCETEKKSGSEFQFHLNLEELRLIYVSMTRSFGQLHCPEDYIITDKQITAFKKLVKSGFIELWDGATTF
ncbi:MAG: AAA family ATPase [Deltaproteobacteria bacterium]|jgi:superfamily I DNA/RNA helicase|nr:AAA family ATPase [Deltaproteobacteria bacterium]